MQCRHGGTQKLAARDVRRHEVVPCEASTEVVLAGLRHDRHVRGQLLAHDGLGIEALIRVAHARELAAWVPKDLAAAHDGKKLLGNSQPLGHALRDAPEPRVRAVERLRAEHAHALARKLALLALLAQKLARQRRVPARELAAVCIPQVGWNPHADPGTEVVVARDVVVEAQALRARPDETKGEARLDGVRKPGHEHGAERPEVPLGQLHAPHVAPRLRVAYVSLCHRVDATPLPQGVHLPRPPLERVRVRRVAQLVAQDLRGLEVVRLCRCIVSA